MATLTVGQGSGFEYNTLSSAVSASQNGDVIQIEAGTYTNDFSTVTTNITIEGVGGMADLVATQAPPNLQGILTIGSPGASGPTVTISNVSFSGAAIPDSDGANGAGIRYKSGDLTLNNTYFHNNQDGLLADADPTGTITINNSEFINNGDSSGSGSGYTHNLYVGAIDNLTVNNSYFNDPNVGHDIKSRAASTVIEDSRIDDSGGTGSYEIDLPNGGNAVIENNVIEKGAGAQNPNFISFGEEGNTIANSSLSVTGNTVENDKGSNATFVANDTTTAASITGNTFYGLTSGQVVNGPVGPPENNSFQSQASEPPLDTSAPFLACFAAGTRILTDRGMIPVEALQVGQRAVMSRPGIDPLYERTLRPIRWIGHRSIDFLRHPAPRLVRPIRIRADTLADGVPVRDLVVSPDHGIHIDGALIPARFLVNDATIVRDEILSSVVYFHVELDRHDILLAEGLAAESYLDTGNRGVFENADVPVHLHPDLATIDGQRRREMLSCVPLVTQPVPVQAAWRRLAVRAWQLGYVLREPATTVDPGLQLLADGRACNPIAVTCHRHTFIVPRHTGSCRLVSRAGAPCDIAPWIGDYRQLGVAVGRIVLHGPQSQVMIPADHPELADGWWAAESDATTLWRWTKGDAVLRLPADVDMVEIWLAGENTYLVPTQDSEPTGLRYQAA